MTNNFVFILFGISSGTFASEVHAVPGLEKTLKSVADTSSVNKFTRKALSYVSPVSYDITSHSTKQIKANIDSALPLPCLRVALRRSKGGIPLRRENSLLFN